MVDARLLLAMKVVLWIVAIVIFLSLLNFFLSVRPLKFKTGLPPDKLGLKYENVSFTTEDGLEIKGWYLPAEVKTNKTIIVTHGYPFDKQNVLAPMSFLQKKFNMLLFDFRYFGESEGAYTSVGYHEQKDFLAAVKWLKAEKKTKEIGTFGFSLGAATSLMANSPDVKAIVADSSYATLDRMVERTYFFLPGPTKAPLVWLSKAYAKFFLGWDTGDVRPLDEIPKIKAQILFIHGEDDFQIPPENSQLLYDSSNKSRTELWMVSGAGHGRALSIYRREYEKRVIEFFEKNL